MKGFKGFLKNDWKLGWNIKYPRYFWKLEMHIDCFHIVNIFCILFWHFAVKFSVLFLDFKTSKNQKFFYQLTLKRLSTIGDAEHRYSMNNLYNYSGIKTWETRDFIYMYTFNFIHLWRRIWWLYIVIKR